MHCSEHFGAISNQTLNVSPKRLFDQMMSKIIITIIIIFGTVGTHILISWNNVNNMTIVQQN